MHTGFWQKALRKETASVCTNLSRLGVRAAGFPMCPSTSPRHSSGLKITMLGSLLISSPL